MKSICFIGDSHVAAIANAARNSDIAKRHFDSSHFAANHAVWGNSFDFSADGLRITPQPLPLRLSGSRLTASTEALSDAFMKTSGVSDIAIEQFHAFVLVGLSFSMFLVIRLSQAFRHDRLPKANDRQILTSDGCFHAAAKGLLAQTASIRVAQLIRRVVGTPIFIVAEPFPSRDSPKDAAGKLGAYNFAERSGYSAELVSTFNRASSELEQEFGLCVITPPGETIRDWIFTDPRFSRASSLSLPPSEKAPEQAFLHTNEQWGELTVRNLAAVAAGADAI